MAAQGPAHVLGIALGVKLRAVNAHKHDGLALKPRLILADEPTGNLDTHTADDIFALLREFNRQTNCACLIVTHDPRLAARCDRIVRLVDGQIADDLPTA